jgi:hypothetical protein
MDSPTEVSLRGMGVRNEEELGYLLDRHQVWSELDRLPSAPHLREACNCLTTRR